MQPFSHLGRYLKLIDKFVARRRAIALIQLVDDLDIALREQIKRKFPRRFCFGRRGSHSRREFQHACSHLSAQAGSHREIQKSRQNKEFSHTGNRSRWSDGGSAVLPTCFVELTRRFLSEQPEDRLDRNPGRHWPPSRILCGNELPAAHHDTYGVFVQAEC